MVNGIGGIPRSSASLFAAFTVACHAFVIVALWPDLTHPGKPTRPPPGEPVGATAFDSRGEGISSNESTSHRAQEDDPGPTGYARASSA